MSAAEVDTGYFRGAGGTIFKIDVPTRGIPAERFAEQLEKGDLVRIDDSLVEEVVSEDGVTTYVSRAPDEAPAKRGSKKAAADAEADDA